MKRKLESFVKMLYSNTEVLKAHKASFVITFLLFMVNITLISSPNFVGMMRGTDQIDQLDNVREAFREMYDDELACAIDDNAIMHCEDDEERTYGNYTFQFVEDMNVDELDSDDVSQSSIIFSPTNAAIVYVENAGSSNETMVAIGGNYRLLSGIDFSEIKAIAEASDSSVDSYYNSMTTLILEDLYYSTLADNSLIVYTTQFAQMVMYTFFVSIMFLVLNYRAKFKKLSYPASIKITVFAATGPALFTALLGFFITAWASMLFVVLYLARVVLVYYKINTVEETLK